MEESSFEGLVPLIVGFNRDFYSLFSVFPDYIGKLCIGFLYGFIIGFIFSFWRREIFYAVTLSISNVWILSFLKCISVDWARIFFLLGLNKSTISWRQLLLFFNVYLFEIIVAFFVAFIFYKTVEKYQFY